MAYFGEENGRTTRASVWCERYDGDMISCSCDTSHTAIHLNTAGIREGKGKELSNLRDGPSSGMDGLDGGDLEPRG